jgi:hypothetical protein
MCILGFKSLKFIIKIIIFFAQNFKSGILGPIDNIKQASKQKKNSFLKFKQVSINFKQS